jgi:hypothetical protein
MNRLSGRRARTGPPRARGAFQVLQKRRRDARAQLTAALDVFEAMGAKGFAERARIELLVQPLLPVDRHPARWSRYRLVDRVMERRSQARTVEKPLGSVVPEPGLVRLETTDDRMAHRGGMTAPVLRRGLVATADVSALRAATQMQPPPGSSPGLALHATRPARS